MGPWWTAISDWLRAQWEILTDWQNWLSGIDDFIQLLLDIALAPIEAVLSTFGTIDFSVINPFFTFVNIFIPVGEALDSTVVFFELLLGIWIVKTIIKLIPTTG